MNFLGGVFLAKEALFSLESVEDVVFDRVWNLAIQPPERSMHKEGEPEI